MSFFNQYVLIINIVGFIVYLINTLLYSFTSNKDIDDLVTIICILGGSFGIFLMFMIVYFITKEKPDKELMMSTVFLLCFLVVDLIIFLVINGFISSNIDINIVRYLMNHKYLSIYLIIINIASFIIFALDKLFAIKHMWRVSIIKLLTFAFLGGSIGEIISMYLFHHKSQKDYFRKGLPMILMMQVLLLIYVMNI